MAYKQSPGRMNMPKTGRGLDASALMKGSPAKAAFPIKEKTKLGMPGRSHQFCEVFVYLGFTI